MHLQRAMEEGASGDHEWSQAHRVLADGGPVPRPLTPAARPSVAAADRAAATRPAPAPTGSPRSATGAAVGAAAGAAAVGAPRERAQPRPQAGPRPAPSPVPTGARSAAGPRVEQLAQLARSTRQRDPGLVWKADQALSKGRNAHHTNTPTEMREALRSRANWLEGDLRLGRSGTPVMAHDADAVGSGLKLDDWLQVGSASRRGMKVDVKEPAAIPKLLGALERSGIPQGRLMVNVGGIPTTQVREIRERLPRAWIALNPSTDEDGRYSRRSMQQAIRSARVAGDRVVFPLRWDLATDEAIAALKPYGAISIWTSSRDTPANTRAEERRLRQRGVDGVIDFGPPRDLADTAARGWFDAVHRAGDAALPGR